MKRLWVILFVVSFVWGQFVLEPKLPWDTVKKREGQSLISHLRYWRNSANWEEGIKLNTKTIYDYSTNEINNKVITTTTYNGIRWGSRDTTIRVEFFDENNNLILRSDKELVNGDTINLSNRTFTYDSNSNLTENKLVRLNDGLIHQAHKYLNSYDKNNNLIEIQGYSLDFGSQSYLSYASGIYSHSYDNHNNRDTTTVQLYHFSYKKMWNDSKFVYSYDSNNNITKIVRYKWDYVNGTSWEYDWEKQYIFDSNNKLIIEYVDIGDIHYYFSYDSDGRLIEYNTPLKIYTLSHSSILTTSEAKTLNNGEITSKSEYHFKNLNLPTDFEWVSSPLDTVNITQTNTADVYKLEWTKSTDADGDSITYILYAGTGVYPAVEVYDTTSTSVLIPYQEFLQKTFEQIPMLSRATVKFSVSATDGIDTVKVTGDDRVVFVNRYDYLSTEETGIPTEFALHENYPNPFNPTTSLRFDLPEVSDVTVSIFNMLGQKIKTFNMNDTPAGYHSIKWDATNDYGDPVGAGVYLYQLRANQFVKTKKMVLLK